MALTRGSMGLAPCPICYVPAAELSNLAKRHPLRTAADSQAKVIKARSCTTKKAAEEILSPAGLRDVDVRH